VPQVRLFYTGNDQYSAFLLVRCDAVLPGNKLSTFRYKLAQTSAWNEIFLILSTLEYEKTGLSRNVQYQLPSDTAS